MVEVMFSKINLDYLTEIFHSKNEEEMARVGLLLIEHAKRDQQTLIQAVSPLEELAEHIRMCPYSELSSACQHDILLAVEQIESSLETHDTADAVVDRNNEMLHCCIDELACQDTVERREYFECSCENEEHLFKFSLNPNNGDFGLNAYLHNERGFWKRLFVAINYIFGYAADQWDCVMLDRPATERLHRLTNEALDVMNSVATKNVG